MFCTAHTALGYYGGVDQHCTYQSRPTMISNLSSYDIAGNFRGRKLSQISEKYDFHREKFHGLLTFATPKDATLQISQRKFPHMFTKPRNSRKFSPTKVFHYTVLIHCITRVLVYETYC